jgi:hypothetical protein
MFVDLVKTYDTVNHEMLFEILERYGAHPKYVDAIRRLYHGLKFKITIGKESAEIPQTVEVRQGDNLSPVLFLFLMSALGESFDDELEFHHIEKVKCRRVSLENVNSGQLIGHKPTSFKTGEEFSLFDIYYVDDGAFIFSSRRSIEIAVSVVNTHIARFGLEMHIGTIANGVETPSKTECIVFPPLASSHPLPLKKAARKPPNQSTLLR